jgi:hypothetical protein
MVKHHLWKLIVAVVLAATLAAPGVSATPMVFQAPPPNDNFVTATVVTNLPFRDSVDMAYATTESNEPQPCAQAQKTVWYSYTPTTNEALRVIVSGFYDTNLVIYQANGPDITNLGEIDCAVWNDPVSIAFNASGGTTYYFQVGTILGSGGTAALTVETVPPPANDNFSDATVISGMYFSQSVDATVATTEAGEPTGNCGYTPQHTVWYKFTAPANGLVSTSLSGSYYGDTILYAYRADGEGFGGLSPSLGCGPYGNSFWLHVQANQTYYFQAGTLLSQSNFLYFTMSFTPAPANDNFADAKVITALPYDDNTDMTGASTEVSEPMPLCGSTSKTVWYAYTPTESGSLSQLTYGTGYTVVGAYTGGSVNTLQEVACRSRDWYEYNFLTFHADAGTTYYFQVGIDYNTSVPFHLEVAPSPVANFGYTPSDPNIFDIVTFDNYSWDPVNTNFDLMTRVWDFGDGTTLTVIPPTNEPWSPSHKYVKDGDYTVKLTVTTPDGRTASTSQTVHVKTHDVAITKFSAPQSASAGQTRQLVAGINSKIYAETVRVEFYKSVPGGYVSLGYQDQSVPVRSANRTTNFQWSYTFTKDDATIGKVTFKAVATILEARDALPADNEAIASPTKVAKK